MRAKLLVLIASCLLTPSSSWCQDAPPTERRQQGSPYASLFTLRGIEFSDAQRNQIAEIRNKYLPQLMSLQKEQQSVFTDDQRRARQEAIRDARSAGKSDREAREAVDEAVQLSEQQKASISKNQQARVRIAGSIQNELRSLLNDQQRARVLRSRRNDSAGRKPTHADVKYGPAERNVMDVWLSDSDQPTPVLVSIHGGGFRGGNKSVGADLLRECLQSGISVAAITYRLSDEAIAPAQFHDAARAIQFIRNHAKQWNLDPSRVAATGGSAGAGLSLWLGFHEDMADPDSDDPVERESTRLTCMVVFNGQTSYDPRVIRELFPGKDTYKHSALAQLYGVDLDDLDNLPEEKYGLMEEVSALPHLSRDDVPAMLVYAAEMDTEVTNQGVGIHHPRFGKMLKAKMDPLGLECTVETGVSRGDENYTKLAMEFIKRHFEHDSSDGE